MRFSNLMVLLSWFSWPHWVFAAVFVSVVVCQQWFRVFQSRSFSLASIRNCISKRIKPMKNMFASPFKFITNKSSEGVWWSGLKSLGRYLPETKRRGMLRLLKIPCAERSHPFLPFDRSYGFSTSNQTSSPTVRHRMPSPASGATLCRSSQNFRSQTVFFGSVFGLVFVFWGAKGVKLVGFLCLVSCCLEDEEIVLMLFLEELDLNGFVEAFDWFNAGLEVNSWVLTRGFVVLWWWG